jgi:hypothetical protein
LEDRQEPGGEVRQPTLPAPTLARNLAYVLRKLASRGPNIIDVLLFCRLSEREAVPSRCDDFTIVTHDCRPEEGSHFICLSS